MHLHEYVRATEINLIFYVAISILSPVLAPYIKSLGFNDVQLSLLFSVTPLALIFSSPIIGRISDKIGRSSVLFIAILGEIIAIFLYTFSTSWIFIVIARILDAIAAITVVTTALAKIEDSLKNGVRGKYTGISLSIEYIGRLIGPLIGGLLADMLFIKAPFITAISIIFCLFLFIPKKKINKKHITKKEFNWVGDIHEFLSYKKLKGMAILGIVMHATFPAFSVFLPLLIIENMGLSYSYVGYAYFALGVMHIMQFIFGKWSDKKTYRVVLAGTMISGIFTAMISQTTVYYILLIILFLKGIPFMRE